MRTERARSVLAAGRGELRERIVTGHPVDPGEIEGWAYRGISLALPRAVERLTWKTFQKTFWRDPATERLLGWNVRLHQDGPDAPSRPKTSAGRPRCVWFYEVVAPTEAPAPAGFDRGLIIDYGRGRNPTFETIRWMKDPLVALEPGDPTALLGVTYAVMGGLCVETPTYFLLEREHPIRYVPESVAP